MSEANDDILEFDLVLKEIPIKIRDEKGVVHEYILREMDGKTRDRYLNTLSSRLKVDDKGKVVGVKNFDGFQASLLRMCVIDKSNMALVDEATIQTWPSKAQSTVYKKAQELSGLDDAAMEKAKND